MSIRQWTTRRHRAQRAAAPLPVDATAGPHERALWTVVRALAETTSDPERRLMASILGDAVALYRSDIVGDGAPSPTFQAIRAWVEDTDRTFRFSFETICETLGLDREGVRAGLRALQPAPQPPGTAAPTATEPWTAAADGDDGQGAPPGTTDPAASRELAAAVAANLRHYCPLVGFSLADVARDAGIEPEQLQAMEAGMAAPSLRMVWQLAVALRVPFGALLERAPAAAGDAGVDFRVRRATEGPHIASPDGLRSRPLFGERPGQRSEIYELALAAGASDDADAHAAGTWEQIVVTRGMLRVRAGEREADLDAHDAIVFRADRPHRYQNPGGEPAEAILVMVYP